MKIEKQNPGFAKRVKSWLTGKYVENGSTASQNIPAGKWVTWKGQVCKSKVAITTGDTLSSTNLETDDEGTLNGGYATNRFSENNKVMLTTNAEYTVPKDGLIIAFIGYEAGTFLYVSVNGITVIQISTGGSVGFTSVPFRVYKGDIVKIDNQGGHTKYLTYFPKA